MATGRMDGSYQSTNVPTYKRTKEGNSDTRLYRCMVVRTIFTDEQDNITTNASNPRVLYDCVVLGGFKAGQVISNCRLSSDLASNTHYHERVLRPSTQKLNKVRLGEHDGDVVFVQFVQGRTAYPVITALDIGLKVQDKIGAKKADGLRYVKNYNGVTKEIDKDGQYSIKRQGGEYDPENTIFNESEGDPEYQLNINKEEKVTETFKSGLSIEKDGINDKITETLASGTKIEKDGKNDIVTVTTAGGAVIEVDGNGGTINVDAGGTTVEIDSNSGKISLLGDLVDIGSSVSDFAVLLTELITQFNSHTHIAPQAPSGSLPTTPPTSPLLQTAGSTTVQLQS